MNNDELLKENISIALKKIGNYIYEGAFPFTSSFKYIKNLVMMKYMMMMKTVQL